jgi:hypothetical protein
MYEQHLTKTAKKISEIADVMNKEFNEISALNNAEYRLAALVEFERKQDEALKGFERHVIYTDKKETVGSTEKEQIEKFERNQKISASILAVLEYSKSHPMATEGDLRKLGIPLPTSMSLGTLILIARCARIEEKYEGHKVRLMGDLFTLVRSGHQEKEAESV